MSGNTLYAGGTFTKAGGVAANYVAAWNGSAWSALGSGIGGNSPEVAALAVSGNTLYAGGVFQLSTASGVFANDIAAWNGSAWSGLSGGVAFGVSALAVSGTTLYAGGDVYMAGGFAEPGQVPTDGIAAWNGGFWSTLGGTVNGTVEALAVIGSTLYVGGSFTNAGGVMATNIAAWNGSTWSALGSGITADGDDGTYVFALAVSGSTLYAGGSFTTAGGVQVNNIAAWNGSAWSALGAGMGGVYEPCVYALAVSASTLYAGGWFTSAGGVAATNIAAWNGSTWSALGAGMTGVYDPAVSALAVNGNTLYAGGTFTNAGGVAATNIAAWNGSAWSALGSGLGGGYRAAGALAVIGSRLYVGGAFTSAGGVAANNIAAWNGSVWSALASGLNGEVGALAVSGTNLYVGGWFTSAGGVAANYLAAWNGSTWSALGSGVSWQDANPATVYSTGVRALAADGSGHLFVGGDFSEAGTNVSLSIAQANIGGGVSVSGGRFGGLAYSRATGFSCTFSNATIGQPYRVQASPSLAIGSWTDLSNFTYPGPMVISDPAAGLKKFYRAVSP